jgi:hypothetical protein
MTSDAALAIVIKGFIFGMLAVVWTALSKQRQQWREAGKFPILANHMGAIVVVVWLIGMVAALAFAR